MKKSQFEKQQQDKTTGFEQTNTVEKNTISTPTQVLTSEEEQINNMVNLIQLIVPLIVSLTVIGIIVKLFFSFRI